MLRANGGLDINGTAAGAYRIVKPVGGKHGYLVEASGLTLAGGNGALVGAAQGTGGFLWAINDDTLDITFAPDVVMTLRKMPPSLC
jgi:hypothetical protein